MTAKPKVQPITDFELIMVRAYEGQAMVEQVTAALLKSSFLVMADTAMPAGKWLGNAKPLMVNVPSSGRSYLPMFTHLSRLDGWAEAHPDFPHPHMVSLAWLLKAELPDDVGLAINLGWPAAMEIPPAGIVAMRAQLGE
ncbi:MAG: hypothetical protein JWP35_1548 [Caulobacter sp.]|nr:hypothetical protein [Caulobacter sp.]